MLFPPAKGFKTEAWVSFFRGKDSGLPVGIQDSVGAKDPHRKHKKGLWREKRWGCSRLGVLGGDSQVTVAGDVDSKKPFRHHGSGVFKLPFLFPELKS